MLANVHLYFFVEDEIQEHVITEQVDALSVTDLTNMAYHLTRYQMDGSPRENRAIHVNFEFV